MRSCCIAVYSRSALLHIPPESFVKFVADGTKKGLGRAAATEVSRGGDGSGSAGTFQASGPRRMEKAAW